MHHQLIDTSSLTKLYYSISEVADMFDVNASLIRFWEKEFKEINPKKNKRGVRNYTVKDIQTFQKIYYFVKVKGFTLEGARMALKTNEPIDYSQSDSVIDQLERIKIKLLSLKSGQ